MIKYIALFAVVSFAFASYAIDSTGLDQLKAKELVHKCKILERLEKKQPENPNDQAKLDAEIKNLKKALKSSGKDCP